MNSAEKLIGKWFQHRGWQPFSFQRETWKAYRNGESGIVHAPTGTGKTLSVWMGPLAEALDPEPGNERDGRSLKVLWITPLRALATDTVKSLRAPLEDFGLNLDVELRTGDTSSYLKQKQNKSLPFGLVTTPESLSILLARGNCRDLFKDLRCIIVDEWHELMGTKRGVQTELCLARLRTIAPEVRQWGLSATLGNLDEALEVFLGSDGRGRLIEGKEEKEIVIETLVPKDAESFPWGGHLGLKQLDQVLEKIGSAESSLVFTNTRSQAELWFQSIIESDPSLIGKVGLHHGSLDQSVRKKVEHGLDDGSLRAVVATSSLDLGVDFSPVDQVIQIGSPKGAARILQRAGRAGHRPGAPSRIIFVPTNTFELIEMSAAREMIQERRIESRTPLVGCLDVVAQHLVTLSMGGGFREEDAYKEIRKTYCYRQLSREEWNWVLDFLGRGGESLKAYPEYAKIGVKNGNFKVMSEKVGRMHKMSIGTITSDSHLEVKYKRGGRLGSIEEFYLSRLNPGETFLFAGKSLQFIEIKNGIAYVKSSHKKPKSVPRWMGGKMPLSTLLAEHVRARIADPEGQVCKDIEMEMITPLLMYQDNVSALPKESELLIESFKVKEGHSHFVFNFAGRLANEGIVTLAAFRISRLSPVTITTFCNDYGFQLLSSKEISLNETEWREMLSPRNLKEDLMACVNATELARGRFRAIARIAGLLAPDLPSRKKSMRQLQASSNLLFDVFTRFDPENRLLKQAYNEVLENELEYTRLNSSLDHSSKCTILQKSPRGMTPLSFPIWSESIRSMVSSEKVEDRLRDAISELETMTGVTTQLASN